MLKRKHPNKDTEKGPSAASANPEQPAPSERRPDDVVADKTQPTAEERRRQQVQVLHDQRSATYPHKSVPPGHGNSPELLKYYLAQNFASPANLAREANVSRAAVSAVIHGRMRSERIERMIAASCGRTLQELFPTWYQESK